MFDTYGPFTLTAHDGEALDDLFVQIRSKNKDLQYAIGVYVIAVASPAKHLVPCYVGQTWKEFGSRILQHYKSRKFLQLIKRSGPLYVFLIPRATSKRKVRKSTPAIRKSRGLKSIDWLELQLIDRCLKLNPQLMNVSENRFHKSLYVPGFRDEGDVSREPAAKALRKLLKVK
jgi:hypothetical protein